MLMWWKNDDYPVTVVAKPANRVQYKQGVRMPYEDRSYPILEKLAVSAFQWEYHYK